MNLLFFKQKTAYEMRISDWSSDVCSSDLVLVCALALVAGRVGAAVGLQDLDHLALQRAVGGLGDLHDRLHLAGFVVDGLPAGGGGLLGNRNQRQQCQRKPGGSIGSAWCRDRVCPSV